MTDKQRAARRHNGLMGHAAMIRRCAMTIMESPTTTTRAKNMAGDIADLVFQLDLELRAKRIDPSA